MVATFNPIALPSSRGGCAHVGGSPCEPLGLPGRALPAGNDCAPAVAVEIAAARVRPPDLVATTPHMVAHADVHGSVSGPVPEGGPAARSRTLHDPR